MGTFEGTPFKSSGLLVEGSRDGGGAALLRGGESTAARQGSPGSCGKPGPVCTGLAPHLPDAAGMLGARVQTGHSVTPRDSPRPHSEGQVQMANAGPSPEPTLGLDPHRAGQHHATSSSPLPNKLEPVQLKNTSGAKKMPCEDKCASKDSSGVSVYFPVCAGHPDDLIIRLWT